jgi:serine/threonine-protein kinase PRP4
MMDDEKQEPTEEEIIAERRRKRQAILDKYKQKESASAVNSAAPAKETASKPVQNGTAAAPAASAAAASPVDVVPAPAPAPEPAAVAAPSAPAAPAIDVSDMAARVAAALESAKAATNGHAKPTVVEQTKAPEAEVSVEEPPARPAQMERRKSIGGDESGEAFDMFGATDVSKLAKPKAKLKKSGGMFDDSEEHLQSNWTQEDGYYAMRVGELICDRYKVMGTIGRGVFSTVLKCSDERQPGQECAVKMIRNNETMRKAAQLEIQLLQEIGEEDPDNKKHCVQMLAHVEHRNHVCLVFEMMSFNLRETVKKYGGKQVLSPPPPLIPSSNSLFPRRSNSRSLVLSVACCCCLLSVACCLPLST